VPRSGRSSPPAFANLQAYLEWYADVGKNRPCCDGASITEIRANPQQFDCARCDHAAWDRALFAVNAQALALYRRLCGRTVVDLGLAGQLLHAATQGWASSAVVDLIARLERIRSVLDPPRSSPGS
jgi:hypothetical protein